MNRLADFNLEDGSEMLGCSLLWQFGTVGPVLAVSQDRCLLSCRPVESIFLQAQRMVLCVLSPVCRDHAED